MTEQADQQRVFDRLSEAGVPARITEALAEAISGGELCAPVRITAETVFYLDGVVSCLTLAETRTVTIRLDTRTPTVTPQADQAAPVDLAAPSRQKYADLRLRLAREGRNPGATEAATEAEMVRRCEADLLSRPGADFERLTGQTVEAYCDGLPLSDVLVADVGVDMARAAAGILQLARHGEGLGRIVLQAPTGRPWLVPYDCATDHLAFEQALDTLAVAVPDEDQWERLIKLRLVDQHLRTLVPAGFPPQGGRGSLAEPPAATGVWGTLLALSLASLQAAAGSRFQVALPAPGEEGAQAARYHFERRLYDITVGNAFDRVLWPVNVWVRGHDGKGPRAIGATAVVSPEH